MVSVPALTATLTRVETWADDVQAAADEGCVERNNCMSSDYPFQTLWSHYIVVFQSQFLLSAVDDVTGSVLVQLASCCVRKLQDIDIIE
jgi:hypothetical protein